MLIYFKPKWKLHGKTSPSSYRVADGGGPTSLKWCLGAQPSSMTQKSHLTQPADARPQLRLKNTCSVGIFWRGHHALAPKILYFRALDSFDWILMLKVTASELFIFFRKSRWDLQLTGKSVVYLRNLITCDSSDRGLVDILDMWREGVWDYIRSLNILKHV